MKKTLSPTFSLFILQTDKLNTHESERLAVAKKYEYTDRIRPKRDDDRSSLKQRFFILPLLKALKKLSGRNAELQYQAWAQRKMLVVQNGKMEEMEKTNREQNGKIDLLVQEIKDLTVSLGRS
jgi:hypothetical protein